MSENPEVKVLESKSGTRKHVVINIVRPIADEYRPAVDTMLSAGSEYYKTACGYDYFPVADTELDVKGIRNIDNLCENCEARIDTHLAAGEGEKLDLTEIEKIEISGGKPTWD